ncbi:MAG: glycosyltransferase [Roseomonas sp.]|nr:glycosyltransferase [Roseomonas sp.]MCA3342301.1 glycosyltransferase [Roseomonas sp.]
MMRKLLRKLRKYTETRLLRAEPTFETAVFLKSEGDRLRDDQRWTEAAASYAAYLETHADDWPIWVQRGHCLKEAGDLTGGLAAYHQALIHAPNDSDLQLQIGHALKLLGQPEEAIKAYRAALALDEGNSDAEAEIATLEQVLALAKAEHQKATPPRATRLMFDITDLVQYMKEWRIPTGIQRVQLNVIYHALTAFAERANPIIIHFDQSLGTWLPISQETFFALHDAAESSDSVDEGDFLALFEMPDSSLFNEAEFEKQLEDNDVILVNLGTSWWIENYFLKIRDLRKKYGIRYVPMIHDVIPLMMPEHCAERLVEEFSQWFSTLVLEVDGAVTNSQWSAMDVRHHASRLLPDFNLPVHPVALNGDMRRYLSERDVAPIDSLRHILPPAASFVLCVSTLESRKNHVLLFKAWDSLLDKHDAASVPFLICLGKSGWLFEEGAEFLRSRPSLNSKILLISSVSDSALETLYRESLFTIFNSFYEGWGLPVTESLSYGTLPLVACHTSLSEAGGRAAVYFRADDVNDLVAKLELLIFNDERRQELRDHACANANLREWRAVAEDFIEKILKIEASASARQEALLRVPIGRPIHLGKSDALVPSLDLAMANLLRDGLNWHRLEDWGCWTAPGTAMIRLPLPDEALGQDLLLYLRLRGTAVDTSVKIQCSIDGKLLSEPVQRLIGDGTRHSLGFRFRSDSRNLTLAIDAGQGSSLGPGDRDVGIGVTHVMICRADDLKARQDFMMRFPELQERIRLEQDMMLEVTELQLH